MGDEKKKTSRSPLAAAAYGGPVDGNSLESVTPLSMEPEWDPYLHRKYGVGLQPIVGVLRNDRTPLNTPYTPQLMKLHLKRHEAYDERDEYEERPGKQLVTTVKSKIVFVMQPVHKIRGRNAAGRSSGQGAAPYNPLTLEDESRYFQHAEKGTAADGTTNKLSLVEAAQVFQATCKAPIKLENAYPTSKTCFNVLAEVVACSDSTSDSASASSAANLASGALAAEYIPNEFKKQVYNQFHDVCELLRHFLSFKAKVAEGGGPEAQHKLNKIVEKMGSKYDELVKLRESLPPHEKNLLAPLLKPFDDQLNLAFI
ncbi:Tubby protein [Phytophthora nicotianae]|uniref:Tubby protein n=1 Tax=Phytophthora nicotianae TaxID=4792 RepID=A0A0W8DIC8_PHYNI|nr:Tubby protein [Phytophthora nicotianae]